MALSFSSSPDNAPKLRNHDQDYLDAVNKQIAEREEVGVGATPYLLQQRVELEARLNPAPEPKPEPEPVKEPEVEHKAVEAAPEKAVPESPEPVKRAPGRPRKDAGDDTSS